MATCMPSCTELDNSNNKWESSRTWCKLFMTLIDSSKEEVSAAAQSIRQPPFSLKGLSFCFANPFIRTSSSWRCWQNFMISATDSETVIRCTAASMRSCSTNWRWVWRPSWNLLIFDLTEVSKLVMRMCFSKTQRIMRLFIEKLPPSDKYDILIDFLNRNGKHAADINYYWLILHRCVPSGTNIHISLRFHC